MLKVGVPLSVVNARESIRNCFGTLQSRCRRLDRGKSSIKQSSTQARQISWIRGELMTLIHGLRSHIILAGSLSLVVLILLESCQRSEVESPEKGVCVPE